MSGKERGGVRVWVGHHFDVLAAAWLIALVFAWSIYLAALSASRPSDWSGPLVGGVDWYSTIQEPATANSSTVSVP